LPKGEQTSKHGGGGKYNAILEFKGEKRKKFDEKENEKEKERKEEIKQKYMYEKKKRKKCEYE
jgi:hypothetical protein